MVETIRDSTINMNIDVDKEMMEKFIKRIFDEENKSDVKAHVRHEEIKILLTSILRELVRKKKK